MLIETERSFPAVIRACVEREWQAAGMTVDAPGYTDAHNAVLKRHGSFNDDYDIAWTLLCIAARRSSTMGPMLSCAMPDADELADIVASCGADSVEWTRALFAPRFDRASTRARCIDLYFGAGGERGLCSLETPLVHRHWRDMPRDSYVFTGRDRREWRAAQAALGWEDMPDERVITSDTGMCKPKPDAIAHICERFGKSRPIMFGDTESDRLAAAAHPSCAFAAIGPLLAGMANSYATVDDALREIFA